MTPQTQRDSAEKGRLYTASLIKGGGETVTIKAVTHRELPKYLGSLDDECAHAEFICSKPAGWADTVDSKSLGEIKTIGLEVNGPVFYSWAARQKFTNKLVTEGVEAAEKSLHAALPSSSPTSVSAAA